VIGNKLGSFPKTDLDLDIFARFIDCETGKKIPHFTLEGNHGDPIYYPKLCEFIDRFRSTKTFTIVTNGSYRDQDFWHTLAKKMTSKDLIIFSIDGLPETNHLYRINSDWPSIDLALKILKDYPVQVGWKTIIFNYNYQQLDQIRSLAYSYGAQFISQTTSRFGDDALRPPAELIEDFRAYDYNTEHITEIKPQCYQSAKEYVSADGHYWPCCWISSAFTLYKSKLWKARAQWTIKTRDLDQMRNQLAHWINGMQQDPDVVCKMMCKINNPIFPINHGLAIVDQK
jgi:MoaA/NifB/PqqE/SkfB family radical SAM enzyme